MNEGKRPGLREKLVAYGTDQICPEGPVVGPPLNDHHPGAHLDLQGDLPDLVIDAPAHQALTPWLWGRHQAEEDGRVGSAQVQDGRDQVLPCERGP